MQLPILYSSLDYAPAAASGGTHPAAGSGREYIFLAKTGSPDRNGGRQDVTGWQLDTYAKNPIVVLNHNWLSLPVGRARAWTEESGLMAAVQFADTPEARQVEQLVSQGFLRGISAGYIPLEYQPVRNKDGWPIGIHSSKQELVELSIVTIPADPQALRVAGLNLPPIWDHLSELAQAAAAAGAPIAPADADLLEILESLKAIRSA